MHWLSKVEAEFCDIRKEIRRVLSSAPHGHMACTLICKSEKRRLANLFEKLGLAFALVIYIVVHNIP